MRHIRSPLILASVLCSAMSLAATAQAQTGGDREPAGGAFMSSYGPRPTSALPQSAGIGQAAPDGVTTGSLGDGSRGHRGRITARRR